MSDSQKGNQGFELIPIPQEALGNQETEELNEVRRVWNVEAVLWLCSDAASFVTGHALVVDGGDIV